MPPKRKALSETAGNTAKSPHKSKNSTKSAKDTAAEAAKPKYKYCNPSTLSPKPQYQNLEWPNIYKFIDDKDQDMPKDGEFVDAWVDRVSDLGIPLSNPGASLVENLDKETDKRNQDLKDMHIVSDWNGYGVSEVMCNMMADFDKAICKKTVSPYKKWAYVEALACWVKGEEGSVSMAYWVGNEDGESVEEVIQMLGVMVLTCFDVLAEHDLLKPDSEIRTIPIMSLLLLEFLFGSAVDEDYKWACEIVRLCDEAGIELEKHVRKQVSVTKKQIKDMRDVYMKKKEAGEYERVQDKNDWKPEDDKGEDGKLWYRWDWDKEYNKDFRENHPGGSQYDLSKWSKERMKRYKLC